MEGFNQWVPQNVKALTEGDSVALQEPCHSARPIGLIDYVQGLRRRSLLTKYIVFIPPLWVQFQVALETPVRLVTLCGRNAQLAILLAAARARQQHDPVVGQAPDC